MTEQRFAQTIDGVAVRNLARQIRRDVVRMVHRAGSGHPGGALGLADFLSLLYLWGFRDHPDDPGWVNRDRFVLSNGHTCAAWYAVLARTGHLPIDELADFRRLGSRLQGHPSRRALPEFAETSSGPLGQGLSYANGLALALRARDIDSLVWVVLGDGEMQEGQVWEALMTAGHFGLGNVVLVINDNGLQIDGPVKKIMNIYPVVEKLSAFGWSAVQTDGHDVEAMTKTFQNLDLGDRRPHAVVLKTVMGKGVPYMEDKALWHGSCPNEAQTAEALNALGEAQGYEDFPS